MSKKSKSYDRQPFDTDKSWVAFCQYRDMGTERSLDKLVEDRHKIGTKTSRSTLQGWSTKYHWVARCREFDNNELQRQSIALQRERTKRKIAREKDADNYRIALKNRALKMIQAPLRDNWAERDIIAALEASDRFAVISYGGDSPQVPLLQAVEIMVREGVIPNKVLETLEDGLDGLVAKIKESFNDLGDDDEAE